MKKQPLKVAVIGTGNTGSELVSFLDEHPGFELTALVCKPEKPLQLAPTFVNSTPVNIPLEDACQLAGVIVEAANKEVVEQVISLTHSTKKVFIHMSTGCLVSALFNEKLKLKGQFRNLDIQIPSGAIAGLDAIAAVIGEIESLTLTTTKAPASLEGAPFFELHPDKAGLLKNLEVPQTLFEGNLLEAVQAFPKNINVAASLFLASGFSGLKITIVADPHTQTNTHHILCKGKSFGLIETRVENRPSANKRTSQLAVLSGIATLKSLVRSVPALE